MNNEIVVRLKPNDPSPYIRIECTEDFYSVDDLDKFIQVLLLARDLLGKARLEKPSDSH
jgi:hypothetical protein